MKVQSWIFVLITTIGSPAFAGANPPPLDDLSNSSWALFLADNGGNTTKEDKSHVGFRQTDGHHLADPVFTDGVNTLERINETVRNNCPKSGIQAVLLLRVADGFQFQGYGACFEHAVFQAQIESDPKTWDPSSRWPAPVHTEAKQGRL